MTYTDKDSEIIDISAATQDAERKASNAERELFLHYVDKFSGIMLQSTLGLSIDGGYLDQVPNAISSKCCDYAQAVVDEIKARGMV